MRTQFRYFLGVWILVGLLFLTVAPSFAQSESQSSQISVTAEFPTANPLQSSAAPGPGVTIDPKKFDWAGDLRYRFANSQESTDDARPYQQLRARLGFKIEVNPEVTARLRLATHTSAISSNQTLGDSKDPGFSRRSFGLDIGALEWKALPWMDVHGGRIQNPFWSPNKSQIIYDSDLAFEGTALLGKVDFESFSLFGNLGAFIVSENYDSTTKSDVVDTGILGIQLGAKTEWQGIQFTAHFASQQFINIQDAVITSLDKGAGYDLNSAPFNRFKGNRIFAYDPSSGVYYMESKFTLEEVGFEAKGKVAEVDLIGFADFIRNTGSSRENQAHELGLGVKWGRSQLSYAWIRKDSDSVVAAFTDSDSNGGGTDNEGTRLNFAYQFSKNSSAALNHFMATRGKDSVSRDFKLTQVDFQLSF